MDAKIYFFNMYSMTVTSWSGARYGRRENLRKYQCACCNIILLFQRSPATGSWVHYLPLEDRVKFRDHPGMFLDKELSTKSQEILMHFPPFQQYVEKMYKQNLDSNQTLSDWFANYPFLKHDYKTKKSHLVQLSYAKRSIFHYLRDSQPKNDYTRMAGWLQSLAKENPQLTVALQADTQGRFYRSFVATPIATSQFHGTLTFPIFVGDCYHYKHDQYDGVCFNLVTKTSYGDLIPLAWAIIPREKTTELAWIIQMCWKHGLHVNEHMFFTDQGPLVAMFRSFHVNYQVPFYFSLCLQHLIRSIRYKFRLSLFPNRTSNGSIDSAKHCDRLVRHYITAASDSTTYRTFIDNILDLFLHLIDHYRHDRIVDCVDLVIYVLGYDPKIWTVLGNSLHFDEGDFLISVRMVVRQVLLLKLIYEEKPSVQNDVNALKEQAHSVASEFQYKKAASCGPGQKSPRMGFKRTNLAETVASAMLSNNSRRYLPHATNVEFVQMYNKAIQVLHNKVQSAHLATQYLTSPGQSIITDISTTLKSPSLVGAYGIDGTNFNYIHRHEEDDGQDLKDGVYAHIISPNNGTHAAHLIWNHKTNNTSKNIEAYRANNTTRCKTHLIESRNKYSFRFTCSYHVESTQMRASICPCFVAVFTKALHHPSWPLHTQLKIHGLIQTLTFHSSFVSPCSQEIMATHNKMNKKGMYSLNASSLSIILPTYQNIMNLAVPVDIKCPPKYKKRGNKTNGKRFTSNGEFTTIINSPGGRPKKQKKTRRRYPRT